MSRHSTVGAWLIVALSWGCSSEGNGTTPPPGTSGAGGGVTTGGAAGSATVAGSAGSATGGTATAGSGTGGVGGSGGAAGGASDCTAALPASVFCKPLDPLPLSIKGTGLFPAAPDFTQHAASMLEYAPDPPLWSDGMEKQRFLVLPAGKQIDNTDRKRWVFPDGTLFVKTFFDDSGPQGAPRPIETRLIRLVKASNYEFFIYQWNADGSDATLVMNDLEGDINAEIPVAITIKRTVNGQPFMLNGGQPFMHSLPSRDACDQCHSQNGMVTQTFIGFDELRLNSKFKADAAKTQLQTFADAGVFSQPLPADPATITDASNDGGRLLRVKRFLFGNCVTCHNGNGQVDFHPDVLVANTVGKPTEAQSVMPPAGWLRVVPGDPAKSVLYVQMQRTMIPPPEGANNRLRPMPPVGLADVAVEQSSLKDVADWITSLPPN
ncbi:MAG TPA: hypothetical protein VHP33_33265 [Polyangiaceae bacterium]|nr:hypothetical protein [Polyangiaceae bacterium]